MSLFKNISLFFLLFITGNLIAQPITVDVTLDSARLDIGDQTGMHITVNAQPGTVVQHPEFMRNDSLQVLNVSSIDTLAKGAEVITRQRFLLQLWQSGYYNIPALPFAYSLPNGKRDTVFSQPLRIEVSAMPLDSAGIRDIKARLDEPFKKEDALPIIIVLLILAGIGGAAYFLLHRTEQTEETEEITQKRPAHEIALEKLLKLEDEKLWQKGDIKSYQSRLSYIVREYIENRFKILALESTTEEMLIQLTRLETVPGEWIERLEEMLQLADLVKFAKANPPAESHVRLMEYSQNFVKATKPVFVETENIPPSEKIAEP